MSITEQDVQDAIIAREVAGWIRGSHSVEEALEEMEGERAGAELPWRHIRASYARGVALRQQYALLTDRSIFEDSDGVRARLRERGATGVIIVSFGGYVAQSPRYVYSALAPRQ